MTLEHIRTELERMAHQPGIEGSALVEAATGLVWYASGGGAHAQRVWEAAVDYWRLYERQKEQFAVLGPLGAVAMYHVEGILVVLPCCVDPDLLLILHGGHGCVDWRALQRMTRALGSLLRNSD
ncbi:MAG TPA: hypothetical protein VIP05_02315 [Burkholderiaceae bacterium]